ncbi:MAG: tetratricopeptide repeat protein [Bacteroidota bacterium]
MVIFLLPSQSLCAQKTNAADSLKKGLAAARSPEQRNKYLIALGREYYYEQHDTTTAFPYMRNAVVEALQANNDSLISLSYWRFAAMLENFGDDSRLIEYLDKVNTRYITYIPDPQAMMYARRGAYMFRRGKYTDAVEYNLKAIKAVTDTANHSAIGQYYRNLAAALGMSGNTEQVLENYDKALRHMEIARDEFNISMVHMNIAEVYGKLKDSKNERAHLEIAMRIARKIRHYSALSGALSSLSALEANAHHYDKALADIHEAIKIRRDSAGMSNLVEMIITVADIYSKKRDYKNALYYTDSVIAMATRNGQSGFRSEAYFNKAHLLQDIGNYKEANTYLKFHYALKDSIFHGDRERILQDVYTKYRTEAKEAENKLLKKDLELETGRRLFLLIVIIAGTMVIALLLVINYIRRKSEARKRELLENKFQLAEAQAREHELRHIAAEARQAGLLIKQEALSESLEQRNLLLSNLTAYMVRKNEIITAVKEAISKLHNPDKSLLKVVDDMDVFIDINEEWDEFVRSFEAVNPGFMNRLLKQFPELTTKEVKMCSYIRMNLDVKEVSKLFNITPPVVHNFRSRLRKKMNVEPGADLDALILSL